jgi:uncharacterized protein YndB with AHSA1/START domain
MAFVVDLERDVAAPAALVWSAVTDLVAYADWNPFVVGCESTLEPGTSIRMRVRLFPWFVQSQTETVFEHRPNEELCYGLDGKPVGAVVSRRCHLVTAISPGRARYRSQFELSGWLSPLVAMLLGARLRHGFTSMTDALVARAEALAADRTDR